MTYLNTLGAIAALTLTLATTLPAYANFTPPPTAPDGSDAAGTRLTTDLQLTVESVR